MNSIDEILEATQAYLVLRDRLAAGKALSSADRAKWLFLSQSLPGTGAAPEPAEDDYDDGMPVQFSIASNFERGKLLAISRDGVRLFLSERSRLPIGLTTVIEARGFSFACRVVWCREDIAGLVFDDGNQPAAANKTSN